jgi:multidrug efflux pump subunit AcrA (membrane-fusion protein)
MATKQKINKVKKVSSTPLRKPFLKRFTDKLKSNPVVIFSVGLILLIGAIVLGNYYRAPVVSDDKEVSAREVEIVAVGETPKIVLQAEVEKENVITINALTGGIVTSVPVKEGQTVGSGTTLVGISSNYSGGNAQGISRELAKKQLDLAESSYGIQKDSIDANKQIAEKSYDNAQKLLEIGRSAVAPTEGLISQNKVLLEGVDQTLAILLQEPLTPAVEEQLATLKQSKLQLSANLLQLESSLKQTSYQTDTNNPPAKLSELQKNTTLKQLELQERALSTNLDIARLQSDLANLSYAASFPSAFGRMRIEDILVTKGQMVSPGTPLLVVSLQSESATQLTIYAPEHIARRVSPTEDASILLPNVRVNAKILSVSTVPVKGTMYRLSYVVTEDIKTSLVDSMYIPVEVSLVSTVASESNLFIPLDAVYIASEKNYVFVVQDGEVQSRTVTLGSVVGNLVHVLDGLSMNDQLILDRSVVQGEQIVVR